MKIENFLNTIDEYLTYLENATDPEQIAGLADSVGVLFAFLFAIFFGGI